MTMNKLHAMRINKLMTQKELAKASGVSQMTISFTENMLTEPMDLTAAKLARALKCEVEDIFPGREIK